MRLYLSSFRLGAHGHRLRELTRGGRRAVVVADALDAAPAAVRAQGVAREIEDLEHLGFEATELDLRTGDPGELATVDLMWTRGGNVFVLRRAMADSGADLVITDLLRRDALVYGAYSAGCCVLAPDLAGLQHVDEIGAVAEPITSGLGVLDRPFVPHVRSPQHPESAACDRAAAAYTRARADHWALRDGEVLLVDGEQTRVLSAADG